MSVRVEPGRVATGGQGVPAGGCGQRRRKNDASGAYNCAARAGHTLWVQMGPISDGKTYGPSPRGAVGARGGGRPLAFPSPPSLVRTPCSSSPGSAYPRRRRNWEVTATYRVMGGAGTKKVHLLAKASNGADNRPSFRCSDLDLSKWQANRVRKDKTGKDDDELTFVVSTSQKKRRETPAAENVLRWLEACFHRTTTRFVVLVEPVPRAPRLD